MRRYLIAPAAAGLLLLAGCGGNTPAEDAYLAAIQKSSSEVKLSNPGRYLDQGHAICDAMENTKVADRSNVAYLMAEGAGWGYNVYSAASTHLCPEMFPK